MTIAEAQKLIHRALHAEMECTKQANGARGISKRAHKEEINAVKELFKALTGEEPTTETLNETLPG